MATDQVKSANAKIGWAEWDSTKIPVGLISPYVNHYMATKGIGTGTLWEQLSIGGSYRPKLDEPESLIGFDLADKIICFVAHPSVWHEDPELEEAYQRVNLALLDKQISRKASGKAKSERSPVCRNGHARTEENTEKGFRRCRLCNRARSGEHRARKRAKLAEA